MISVTNDLHILPQICQCLRLKPAAYPNPNESLEFTQKRPFILSKLMDSQPTKTDPLQTISEWQHHHGKRTVDSSKANWHYLPIANYHIVLSNVF